jgi:hypothetical protein
MADKIHGFMPATYDPPSDRQRLFLRYFTAREVGLDAARAAAFACRASSELRNTIATVPMISQITEATKPPVMNFDLAIDTSCPMERRPAFVWTRPADAPHPLFFGRSVVHRAPQVHRGKPSPAPRRIP